MEPIGGVARRATLIEAYREAKENLLILDAGDSLLNDRDPAKRTKGQTSVEALNRMGYDALTLGMKDLSLLTLEELKARIGEAAFPVLSANAVLAGSEELLTEPYAVIEIGDRKVGILGLTEPGSTADVTVTDPLAAAMRFLPEIEDQADIIILLSHAGIDVDTIIGESLPDIDLIISGTTAPLTEPLTVGRGGTPLFHADTARPGYAGENVGHAELGFDKRGRLIGYDWLGITLNPQFSLDSSMQGWLDELASVE